MKIKKLEATTQKSYYNRAKIRYNDDGSATLISYSTEVAAIDKNGAFFRLWAGWSATTQKHINDFRALFNLAPLSKKAWQALPCENPAPVYSVVLFTGWAAHTGTAQFTQEAARKEAQRQQEKHGARLRVWYE